MEGVGSNQFDLDLSIEEDHFDLDLSIEEEK